MGHNNLRFITLYVPSSIISAENWEKFLSIAVAIVLKLMSAEQAIVAFGYLDHFAAKIAIINYAFISKV